MRSRASSAAVDASGSREAGRAGKRKRPLEGLGRHPHLRFQGAALCTEAGVGAPCLALKRPEAGHARRRKFPRLHPRSDLELERGRFRGRREAQPTSPLLGRTGG